MADVWVDLGEVVVRADEVLAVEGIPSNKEGFRSRVYAGEHAWPVRLTKSGVLARIKKATSDEV